MLAADISMLEDWIRVRVVDRSSTCGLLLESPAQGVEQRAERLGLCRCGGR